MQDKSESLIKAVYRKWRSGQRQEQSAHPEEEQMACFLDGKLSGAEKESLLSHLLSCAACAENFAVQLKLKESRGKELPADLLMRVKNLLPKEEVPGILEILLSLKDNIFELLNTTGDVLVGQELVPAVILRSRKTDKFRDEVTILKDFNDLRVEIKIENKPGKFFDLTVIAKNKQTSQILKDLRVTLLKDDLELASYLSESGRVIFEHIQLGKYTVELVNLQVKLAQILLEIRV